MAIYIFMIVMETLVSSVPEELATIDWKLVFLKKPCKTLPYKNSALSFVRQILH